MEFDLWRFIYRLLGNHHRFKTSSQTTADVCQTHSSIYVSGHTAQ